MNDTLPTIGHVHLKASDLERSVKFHDAWPRDGGGKVKMFTVALDPGAPLAEAWGAFHTPPA